MGVRAMAIHMPVAVHVRLGARCVVHPLAVVVPVHNLLLLDMLLGCCQVKKGPCRDPKPCRLPIHDQCAGLHPLRHSHGTLVVPHEAQLLLVLSCGDHTMLQCKGQCLL